LGQLRGINVGMYWQHTSIVTQWDCFSPVPTSYCTKNDCLFCLILWNYVAIGQCERSH
jgi:hypothetical protein